MAVRTLHLAGDSHAGGLAPHLPATTHDWTSGRQTRQQPDLPLAPDLVVVSLGTNDYARRELVDEARTLASTRGGRPLVWLLPPHATRPDVAARRPQVVALLRDALRRLPGVRLVDPPVVPVPDGVHATREGYAAIATSILRASHSAPAAVLVAASAAVGATALLLLYTTQQR